MALRRLASRLAARSKVFDIAFPAIVTVITVGVLFVRPPERSELRASTSWPSAWPWRARSRWCGRAGGIRERVALFDGELVAGPRAGGGSGLKARLPISS